MCLHSRIREDDREPIVPAPAPVASLADGGDAALWWRVMHRAGRRKASART
jgi:hypothetical protein